MRLQEFDLVIKQPPGYKLINADAMSGPPIAPAPRTTVIMALAQFEGHAAGDGSANFGYG